MPPWGRRHAAIKRRFIHVTRDNRAGRVLAVAAGILLPLLAGCDPKELVIQQPTYDPAVPGRQEFRPFTFILAGDPQIGMWPGGRKAEIDNLKQLTEQVNGLRPDFVLFAGDLTEMATEHEYDLFDEGVRDLRPPAKLIMGNHDLYRSVAGSLDRFRRRYGPDTYVFTYNNCDFIAINSTLARMARPGVKQSEDFWNWLEEALANSRANGRDHTFIFCHHPPFVRGRDEANSSSNWPLETRGKLLELSGRYGVEAFLCGHIHVNRQAHDGVWVYTVAGTATCWERQGLGYRVFRVGPDGIEQEFVALSKPLQHVTVANKPPNGAGARQPIR